MSIKGDFSKRANLHAMSRVGVKAGICGANSPKPSNISLNL